MNRYQPQNRRTARTPLKALAQITLAVCLAARTANAADAPVVSDASIFVNLLRMPNGDVQRLVSNSGSIQRQVSTDHGLTWGPTEILTTAKSSTNPTPLVDNTGETHLFQFVLRDTNGTTTGPNTPLVDRFLDIWQYTTSNQGTTWNTPTTIFQGYNASLMRAIQLNAGANAGRIVLPFSNRVTNSNTSPTGWFVIRSIYSDDLGASWTLSPSVLTSDIPTGWNGSTDGAAEPTVFQQNNGTLQMYARSQIGRLTQSTSTDGGATWSSLTPSNFYTSTGPPNSIRLDDGRLMMFWNNATMPQQYQGSVWYAGRDVLHAAISYDDGATWQGYREIYLDPNRHNSGITSGDTGTAYPFPVATADGKALLISGQSTAKAQIKVDPDWLMETSQHEDFSAADPLEHWSVFKSFGPVTSVKRDRTPGATVLFDATLGKNVLSLKKPDSNDPDGATWNFPMAKRGETDLKIMLQPGFQGGSIALGDHFYQPTDIQGEQNAVFKLDISSAGVLSTGAILNTSRWYDVRIAWDLASHSASVLIDGQVVGQIGQLSQARPGASYLRLRSSATGVDNAGFRIASVDQVGLPTSDVKESTRYDSVTATTALTTGSGWTRFKFDDYVPNPSAVPAGGGVLLSNSGVFRGFVQPTTGAAPVGVIVTSSTGVVEFSDSTSSQITSDITGPKNGATLTFTFVHPLDITQPATVSKFSMRFGSTIANNVTVALYDIHDQLLPNYTVNYLDPIVTGGVYGMFSTGDLIEASLIRKIVFTGIGNDAWLLGSFANGTTEFDMAYAGFQTMIHIVPEPSLAGLSAAVLATPLLRPRRRS